MNSDDIIDVADLDCIYLSYDEPQKEEFWLKVKHMVPWAKRVDNVKGSDAAHKAAGEASDTERFILIDGDNMPEESFFNIQLDFTDKDETFRQDNLYWAMHDCYSTTYPNYTPFQAWRAGFREGVKMSLNRGLRPTVDEFKETVASRNLNNLTIWQNVGMDVENGEWAIMGARMGTHMTMLTDWDVHNVQWFDNYPAMWETVKDEDPLELSETYGVELHTKLGLPMCALDSEQSKFFKRHYKADFRNLGPLVTEMEVIRKIEGW